MLTKPFIKKNRQNCYIQQLESLFSVTSRKLLYF